MSVITQRNFSGGELAPALQGRVDTSKYAAGLKTLRNMTVMRSGGAESRAGTQFIAEVSDSTKATRLYPFTFNSDQAYVLEFGNLYIRFYRDGAQILNGSPKTITAVSQQNPGVVASSTHGFSNGDEVYISGIVGMTVLNGRNFKVANSLTNTFTLTYMDGTAVDTTAFTAYASGGTAEKVLQVTTTYTEAELFDLQFVQSADVMTIAHPSHVPRELSRASETSWSLSTIDLLPDIGAPATLITSGAGGSTNTWKVIAVAADGEESLATTVTSADTPSGGAPITVTWTAPTTGTAVSYKLYRKLGSTVQYYLIAETANLTISDTGAAGTAEMPSTYDFGGGGTGILPGTTSTFFARTLTYFQQRLLYGNGTVSSSAYPEKVWGSRIAHYNNFYTSVPDTVATDAFSFSIAGKQVNSIRHLVDFRKLIILTAGGEYVADGDDTGIIGPGAVNVRQFAYNGAATLRPLIVNGNLLYLQARQSIIRDLSFEWQQDGFRGNDLTTFSTHLFDGFEMVDWAYMQTPHSLVWVVRDDGDVNGLTYIPEQQMIAWHRHDWQGGTVESVCTVPESNEDILYLIINRTIDGRTTRYIERMQSRFIDDIVDSCFMDSFLTYDGRNTGSRTMTVSGGTTWEATENLTLTSSTAFFTSSDVGNEIHIESATGTTVRFSILSYTSTTVVTVRANQTVPANLRSTARTTWSKAIDSATGLWHLEGEDVSVFADGYVVASPNNPAYDTVTVADGTASLPGCYAVIHVGLPYVSDLETLNIDTGEGETLADKKKLVTKVTVKAYKSRGIWVGQNPDDDTALTGLTEAKIRNLEDYNEPTDLLTGDVDINMQSNWNSNGRIFIRQVDPLPMTILSVSPAGLMPFRGGA